MGIKRIRHLLLIAVFAYIAFESVGCASMNDRPTHTIQIQNIGKTEIKDVTYAYGDEAPRVLPSLGRGGDSRTMRMSVPESVSISWITGMDGRAHNATVPLTGKVPKSMDEKIVNFEIDGGHLRVYIEKRLPDFKRDRTQIYGN